MPGLDGFLDHHRLDTQALMASFNKYRYSHSNDERTAIGKAGLSGKYVTNAQLARCLVLNTPKR